MGPVRMVTGGMEAMEPALWKAAAFSGGFHLLAITILLQTPALPRLDRLRQVPMRVRLVTLAPTPAPAPTTPMAVAPKPPPPKPKPKPKPVVTKPPPPKKRPKPVVKQVVPKHRPAPPPEPVKVEPEPPVVSEAAAPEEEDRGEPEPLAPAAQPPTTTATTRLPSTVLQADAGGRSTPGLDAIGALVRYLEAHRAYPLQARRRGIEGTVGLAFRIDSGGRLERAEVRRSSGSRLLDKSALRTLKRAFPLPPEVVAPLVGEELTVDLTFRLVDTE